jgi:3-carboxy-cis,cis-muconate cycloisomerase
VGRTLLQQAVPISFGLKAARWLALVCRQVERLREVRSRVLVVQFGGAAGTLASLGDQGPHVMALLAEELGLAVPDLPWHAERDRVADVAAAMGVLAGSMAKIAGDVLLLTQTEVAEVAESGEVGKGGSSAMPQKRNPVDATVAAAAARLALGQVLVILSGMAQEHERAAGAWQAEWDALPSLFRTTACAVERVRAVVAGLQVDTERMRSNLVLTGGLAMSESLTMVLAPVVGRQEAFTLVKAAVERAARDGTDLRSAARDVSQIRLSLDDAALDRALDPSTYLGSADLFVQRALDAFKRLAP